MNRKEKLADLAYFGGTPAFSQTLHVGRPNIGDRTRFSQYVAEMFDRRWLSNNGPLVQEFERKVAEFLRVKHCVALCNATVGLEIAIRAAGLTGEVIVPSFTFVATAHSLQWQEITPVFCDIDPATHNIDPAKIEQLITPKTTGIIGVHLWGRPCDVEALAGIARRHNLTLLFDAAHAFGCSYRGRMIGSFGRAEILSFHATKALNSFEGGAIVSNDDDLIRTVRLMTNFGFEGLDEVTHVGTNGKMTEVCAAMGLTNLASFSNIVRTNRRNYEEYRRALADVPGVHLINYKPSESENYHYIVLELDTDECGIERDTLVQVLHKENIRVRRYFWPGVHRMEPYRSYFPNAGLLLPQTERIASHVIVLPNGETLATEDIQGICGIIELTIKHADAFISQMAYPS